MSTNETNSMQEQIREIIENEPVSLFMKGTPQLVMCGNSDRALRALRAPLDDHRGACSDRDLTLECPAHGKAACGV